MSTKRRGHGAVVTIKAGRPSKPTDPAKSCLAGARARIVHTVLGHFQACTKRPRREPALTPGPLRFRVTLDCT